MSIFVIEAVFESKLEPHLRLTALALADFAAKDGTNIYPSVETVARMTGKQPRAVKNDLRALRELGVLVPDGRASGGVSWKIPWSASRSAKLPESLRESSICVAAASSPVDSSTASPVDPCPVGCRFVADNSVSNKPSKETSASDCSGVSTISDPIDFASSEFPVCAGLAARVSEIPPVASGMSGRIVGISLAIEFARI